MTHPATTAVCSADAPPEPATSGGVSWTGVKYIIPKGFIRPYRDSYRHTTCGSITTMGRALSETYARDPGFYGATFCCSCNAHYPVAEFVWTLDGAVVGS